jgi:hypothetical protein
MKKPEFLYFCEADKSDPLNQMRIFVMKWGGVFIKVEWTAFPSIQGFVTSSKIGIEWGKYKTR